MKKILLIFILILSSALTSCEKSNIEDNPVEAEKSAKEKITEMKSYSCLSEITAISNKGENKYTAEILWESTGKYIIKTHNPEILSGNIILFDGKGIWQYNPNVKSKISFLGVGGEFDGKSKIFISEFMKTYLKNSASSDDEIYLSGIKYLVLSSKTNGGKYFAKQKLWIDAEKKLPIKLETYDSENNVVFSAEFKDFKFNPELDEKTFDLNSLE